MKYPRLVLINEPTIEDILFVRYGTRTPSKDSEVLLSFGELAKLYKMKAGRLRYRVACYFDDET